MAKQYTLKTEEGENRFAVNYAEKLNEEQLAVVRAGDGPCLVLAGPGTGKTRTLVYRAAFLLEKGIPGKHILLVTFTKKAAREMTERIEQLLGYRPDGLWGGTFHHIGNLVLRKYADRLGYRRDFGILDAEDSKDMIAIVMQELGVPDIKAVRTPKPTVARKIISLAENSRRAVPDVIREDFPHLNITHPQVSIPQLVEDVAEEYKAKKRAQNVMDFDDLLTNWLALLEHHPDAREALAGRFRYVLVDEYQDVNALQDEIIAYMGSAHRNVLVVGDDAQSIYSFRGADVSNILHFDERFPDCTTFRLETNYRSTRQILELANASIEQNRNRLEKTLRDTQGEGACPAHVAVETQERQAQFVAQRVLESAEEGVPFSDIAVLFRARYQSAELELELAKRRIPYIVRGGRRFFEQAHIKDVLAYLRLVVNVHDELAWQRVLQLQQGIGQTYARRIYDAVQRYNTLREATADTAKEAMCEVAPPRAQQAISRLWDVLQAIIPDEEGDAAEHNISQCITTILERGYSDYLAATYGNPQERADDVRQLARLAADYETVSAFLDAMTLSETFTGEGAQEAEEEEERVTLTTIHQAKGLEWHSVFLIALKEGEFPNAKAEETGERLEEERRLFFVAVTRCKEQLYLVYPLVSRRWGETITQPSRFLQELPQPLLEEWDVTDDIGNEPVLWR